ncbi:hypothetical protein LDVICp090 [lymphocystis disease virus-China]|uniref:Uncharacterized protein n=2 Tax=Lymphocystis disease virus 2 TaxID=159183 RepID=A0A6F8X3A9_9VIRU|nr:hypothetical protein LDVICp090 [lymphocystis disease virus-China]AAU10935.1 hypothetical protein [lymphocystis disease virus-China]BCB67463.1 hypothetical protein [Lymphocystis disease virus 2]
MCLICYEPSICELCVTCIKTTDISFFVQNKISFVYKNIGQILLNVNHVSQMDGKEIFSDLINEINSFRFLIRSESESISPPFKQTKDDKITAKLHFVCQDVKALRRLLLLILIENPMVLLIDFIRMNLRLLQTQFILLKLLTYFTITELSQCENVLIDDLIILKSNLTISDLNFKLFENVD